MWSGAVLVSLYNKNDNEKLKLLFYDSIIIIVNSNECVMEIKMNVLYHIIIIVIIILIRHVLHV